jgi:hypothetical protein
VHGAGTATRRRTAVISGLTLCPRERSSLSRQGAIIIDRELSMSSTKKIASVAFTGAAATAVTLMAGGPAFAAPLKWHVRNGNSLYPVSNVVKGNLKAGTVASLVDVTTNKTLKCTKAVFSGHVSANSTSANPAVLGKLKKSTTKWSSCKVSGQPFKAHLTTSPNVVASGYNAANNSVSLGKLSGNISGKISGTGFFRCTATITKKAAGSTVPIKYKNATHSFIVNSGHAQTLKVKSANNCLGFINANDTAYFTGTYVVSTPANLNIKRS